MKRLRYRIGVCLLALIFAWHGLGALQPLCKDRTPLAFLTFVFAFLLTAALVRKKLLLRLARVICYGGFWGIGVSLFFALGLHTPKPSTMWYTGPLSIVYAWMFIIALLTLQAAAKLQTKESETPQSNDVATDGPRRAGDN